MQTLEQRSAKLTTILVSKSISAQTASRRYILGYKVGK